ncbi:MAG: hypothetical protein AB7O78_19895 [Thermoleophilia bacterium]
MAAGTLTPGQPTVPWVVWSEDVGGRHAVFVSRLVGGNHFELFNGGRPVSQAGVDAATPDITFFGNVPYISWVATVGGQQVGFVGHFEGTAFVLDTPGGIALVGRRSAAGLIDARVPISSSCAADPFTGDGSACPGGAPDAPFATFTTATHPQALFAEAVGPCSLLNGCACTVTVSNGHATVRGRLNRRSPVGILVQRITGRRRVHGRTVLRLETVGRVPFGSHHKGALNVPWNLRVNGHRLPPGRYLITLRALKGANPVATARPVQIRIR